jgi:phage terminase small subunit
MAKLTDKQAMFVKEYIIDLNATQAAVRAGYSEKTARQIGSDCLSKAVIQDAIQAEMDERSKRTEINQDYVLNTIVNTIDRCQQAEPVIRANGEAVVIENEDGDIVPAYTFQSNSVLKGCELLGKHLKMFTDKTELTGVDGAPLIPTSIKVTHE